MTQKIVECVPNFSEGRDPKKIDLILSAIRDVDGVDILDVDAGFDTNRTVVTLVGAPEPVAEAAFRAIGRAAEVLDMTTHQGAHARHGATDVCPFVPVSGVTMEDCARIAQKLGERVGKELGIGVYMYDQAALRPERRSLAHVRQGEYEALSEKLKKPEWAPDFGPAQFNPKVGVVTIGAREFLIAYNVNLNSRGKDHASDIAWQIREKGRAVRTDQTTGFYSSGKLLKYRASQNQWPCAIDHQVFSSLEELTHHYRNEHDVDFASELEFHGQSLDDLEGKNVKQRGKFRECRAVGWTIPQYDRAQITINLTNFKVTSAHAVLEECRELASARGLSVTGSEIVGVVPYDAMRESARFYLERQGSSRGIPICDLMETAVQSMGLRDVSDFDVKKSVLGLPSSDGELTSMSVNDLADEVSRATPAPGGGSIAALAGALAAALGSMVANLTHGKKKFRSVHGEMEALAMQCQSLKDSLLIAIDADTAAFNEVMDAMRLPKGTSEAVQVRDAAIEDGYKKATEVPFETARLCLETMRLCRDAARSGLESSVTDAAVGALMGYAGLEGAILNVKINLPNIKEAAWVSEVRGRADEMLAQGAAIAEETRAIANEKMG